MSVNVNESTGFVWGADWKTSVGLVWCVGGRPMLAAVAVIAGVFGLRQQLLLPLLFVLLVTLSGGVNSSTWVIVGVLGSLFRQIV